jgi:hypothetical protein
VSPTKGSSTCMNRFMLMVVLFLLSSPRGEAGGGLVLQDDACILQIDFYSAHLTAYQPATSGNEQFCEKLPNTGSTIFVLDYLHPSLKEVPVDFRIIRDVTGQGRFVKLSNVEALGNLEPHSIFYQRPQVQADASLKVEYEFEEKGHYVAVVSAGHPSNNSTYMAVFPIEVGAPRLGFPLAALLIVAVPGLFLVGRYRRRALAVP